MSLSSKLQETTALNLLLLGLLILTYILYNMVTLDGINLYALHSAVLPQKEGQKHTLIETCVKP